MNDNLSITSNTIENLIFEIRGVKVMLDYDLATLFERFPEDFMFELTTEDVSALRCQNGILKTGRGQHGMKTSPQNPIGFKLEN